MPWGFVAGAAIGAIGSVVAGGEQASGQKAAARTQQDMFNTINGQEKPFMDAGVGATTKLSQLLGTAPDNGSGGYGSLTSSFTPADFLANKDPGYDFQLKTGGQALRNADTPGVGSLSGAALKDLMGFNQNMAATGYENAFNRFTTQQNNVFARLSGLAGLGQNAASNTGTAGTSLGTGIAQAQAAAAGSTAAGIAGASQSLGNAASLAYMGGGGSPGYTYSGEASPGAGAGTLDAGGGYTFNTPGGS